MTQVVETIWIQESYHLHSRVLLITKTWANPSGHSIASSQEPRAAIASLQSPTGTTVTGYSSPRWASTFIAFCRTLQS